MALFSIKNKSGQTIAQYAAKNPNMALERFMKDQIVTASQFKGMIIIRRDEVSVTLEQ